MVAHLPHKQEAVGPSPTSVTRVALPENKCRGERQRGSGEGEKVEITPGGDAARGVVSPDALRV